MGKSTIPMAMFNSKLLVYQRVLGAAPSKDRTFEYQHCFAGDWEVVKPMDTIPPHSNRKKY